MIYNLKGNLQLILKNIDQAKIEFKSAIDKNPDFATPYFTLAKIYRSQNMTDAEIDEMKTQINKEAGIDTDDGGIDMPDATDGITRYPQDTTGAFISPEDLGDSDGVNNKGDENGGN